MKRRFIAVGLAAATALSLSVAPARAEENMTSSYEYVYNEKSSMFKRLAEAQNTGDKATEERLRKPLEFYLKSIAGSSKNDKVRGYPIGTTFDLLLASGIAAALLTILGGVAFQQGKIKISF